MLCEAHQRTHNTEYVLVATDDMVGRQRIRCLKYLPRYFLYVTLFILLIVILSRRQLNCLTTEREIAGEFNNTLCTMKCISYTISVFIAV